MSPHQEAQAPLQRGDLVVAPVPRLRKDYNAYALNLIPVPLLLAARPAAGVAPL